MKIHARRQRNVDKTISTPLSPPCSLKIILVGAPLLLVQSGSAAAAGFDLHRNCHQQDKVQSKASLSSARSLTSCSKSSMATMMVSGGNTSPESSTTNITDASTSMHNATNATTAAARTTTSNGRRIPMTKTRSTVKSPSNMLSSHIKVATTNIHNGLLLLQQIGGRIGPTILTLLSLVISYQNGYWWSSTGVSFFTMYSLALLGSSCGFSTFLYFITVGFGTAVALPLAVALFVYMQKYSLPTLTIVHSVLTVIWGIRLATFLLLREYVMWPALHQKIVELQSRMSIPFTSKLLCWLVYSFFYVSLISSCWSRLIQAASSSSSSSPTPLVYWNYQWGPVGYVGILMQVVGLSLETIADWQKTSFKKENRHSWCNVGVWSWSTHPHYLGGGLFWIGTYLSHGFYSPLTSTLATAGLGFVLTVLKGAARSLATKQKEKYGQQMDFCDFQHSHNVFGPKSSTIVTVRRNSSSNNNINEIKTTSSGKTQQPIAASSL